jgi:trigger factor
MQVSVETLDGLKRQLTVTLPSDKVEEEVSTRLKKLARTAKMNGYRPGKAPMSEVVKRYSDDVRMTVAKELVQSSLFEAISGQSLSPAGYPSVDLLEVDKNKDLKYTAQFEVYPTIEIVELDGTDIEINKSEVTDADVNKMIHDLQKQNQNWVSVERKVVNGDRVTIDFEGFVDGVAFEGGKAEGYQVIIGSDSMIPGFEKGIIGAELNKPTEIKVTFPADYGHAPLAGKDSTFNITVTQIEEGQLPELDDAFVEKFGIKEGGLDALKKDIEENMSRMLERQLSSMNREAIFSKFLEKNPIELPTALVDDEIHELKHDMFHRVFGAKHTENEKIPDFPRELFEEQAKRRVHLGLIFSEYVKKHEMTVDKTRIDAMIDKMSGAYEDAEELRKHYHSNKKQMQQLEALVLEEMVAEKLLSTMKVKEKKMTYDAVINPKKENDNKGE